MVKPISHHALPSDDPKQSRRFIETAHEVGADEAPTNDAFGRIVRKLGSTIKGAHQPKRKAPKKG